MDEPGTDGDPIPPTVPRDRPVVVYAGSCPKCRVLSRLVVLASFGAVVRMPLEAPEWQKLYWEDLPEARGSPVLVVGNRLVYGRRVFPAVASVVARSWAGLPARLVRGRARAMTDGHADR
jgi:hypothetical protein